MRRIVVDDIDNMTYKIYKTEYIFFTSIDNAFKIMDIVNNKKIRKKKKG
jgi:hypothetical protein